MYYSLVKDQRGTCLTVFNEDGEPLTVTPDHPNYDKVYEGVTNDTLSEEEVRHLLDLVTTAGTRLIGLSERVSVQGSTLYFDGDPIRNEIAEHIIRLVSEDGEKGWKSLVAFLEKVQTNPNEHSRDSLYAWLKRNFTIMPDGDFIAYKGVNVNEEGVNVSVNSGTAIVNGVTHKGRIPNPDGAVVEMPRSSVQHDTGVGCSTGLHAGTWDYASSFVGSSGRVLIVKINPRDVVSVPTDCDAQKLRVCRYTVLNSVVSPIQAPTFTENEDGDEPEDDDICECGDPSCDWEETDWDDEEEDEEDEDDYYAQETGGV